MRLVSQDKVVDVPYENGALSLSYGVKDVVINYHCSYATKGTELAKYSSQEKALKAMEMVRQAYTGVTIFQNVEPTEDVLEILKNMSMQPMLITSTMNQHTERIDNYCNVVFQFPKDDEIEV